LSALALRPLTFPASLETGLGWLSATLTPLAMVSVGWQLEFRNLRGQVRVLVTGLLWKLVVVPALVLLALRTFDGPLTVVDRVAIAQAAMAPMMTAAVLAAEYRLAATLSAAMAALGVLLSFATVPAWWALSGALG
jgi:predicted permease